MVFGVKAEGVDVRSGKVDADKYEDVARQLSDRFGCKYVAITLREEPLRHIQQLVGVLYDGKALHRSRCYSMYVVDRVGGGDSFDGGLIYGLLAGMPPQDVVEFAAAARPQTLYPRDFNLASLEEVTAPMQGDASGRVNGKSEITTMPTERRKRCFSASYQRPATKRDQRIVQAREMEVDYTGAEANVGVSLANYGLESYLFWPCRTTRWGRRASMPCASTG